MIGMLLYPYFSALIGWVHVNLSQTVQKVEIFFVQKVEIECRKLKLNWLSASGELRVCQWNNRQLLYAICFFGKDEECTNRRKSQAIIAVTIKPFWFQQLLSHDILIHTPRKTDNQTWKMSWNKNTKFSLQLFLFYLQSENFFKKLVYFQHEAIHRLKFIYRVMTVRNVK